MAGHSVISFYKLTSRKLVNTLKNKFSAVPFSSYGNRSKILLDYHRYLHDPKFLRYLGEYRASGNFSGYLTNIAKEDALFIEEIKESIKILKTEQAIKNYGYGKMWTSSDRKLLTQALEADPRLYNHFGAMSYRSFIFLINHQIENIIEDIILIQTLFDYLCSHFETFDGLYTSLNAPYITMNHHKLTTGLKSYEDKMIIDKHIKPFLTKNSPLMILEIGAGTGQLAALFLKEGAKYVIIDLPGMHAKAQYFLYKCGGARVCTYARYLDLGRDLKKALELFDVVFLPPWEKGNINCQFDLTINERSLSEMDIEEAYAYLKLIQKTSRYFFCLNTNKKGWDPITQSGYTEHSSLEYQKYLQMELMVTGTTLNDTLFRKIPHHVYAVYKKIG